MRYMILFAAVTPALLTLSACADSNPATTQNVSELRDLNSVDRVGPEGKKTGPNVGLATFCDRIIDSRKDLQRGATCLALAGGEKMSDYTGPGMLEQSEFLASMGVVR